MVGAKCTRKTQDVQCCWRLADKHSCSHNTPKLLLSYEKDNSDIIRGNEFRISLEFTVMFRSGLWFGVLLALCLFPVLCWSWPPTREEFKAWCRSLQWELCEETQQLLAQPDEAVVRWLGQSIDSVGYTPLHILAQEGNLCLLQVWLLRGRLPHGASVTTTNPWGDTPLHCAAWHGHLPIVQLLLTYGASVTTTNGFGNTPLHCAASNGYLPIVQLLLPYGTTLTTTNAYGNNPLNTAALHGYLPIVQLLLTHGALVTTTNKEGSTPLHCAASLGYLSIAQLLLAHGASVTTTDKYGDTPLHCAALQGYLPIVQLLLAHGASVMTTNKYGNTPLHGSASHGRLSIVKLLLAYGASVMAVNNHNETPLLLATKWSHQSVVQFLSNPPSPAFNPLSLQYLTSFTVWCAEGRHTNRLRALFDGNLPPMLLAVILVELGFEDW